MTTERRRSPRIEILGDLDGHIAAFNVSVAIRNISLGGLSIETDFPLPAGVVHDFRLTLGDGSKILLKGRVVRSEPIEAEDEGSPVYRSGIEFIEEKGDAARPGLDSFIDKIR